MRLIDLRQLTVADVVRRLDEYRVPPESLLRSLARDRRALVRRLAVRAREAAAAARAEAARLRGLYREERRRVRAGYVVAGIDEVGCGPLAGPVLAAAVVLRPAPPIRGLDDSKRLRAGEREALAAEIRAHATAFAVAEASVAEIDRFNIIGATRLAMQRAVAQLAAPPSFLLIDGRHVLPGGVPQSAIVKGDGSCACIAAASIVAKVARDRLMLELDRQYPEYGFARHKGYATAEHLAALDRHGPSPVHRRAFLPERQLPLFEPVLLGGP
ncbi:MAG TPA: ribonuclease HII [bacterium]|nr:ribonuclease HII [bacterium]